MGLTESTRGPWLVAKGENAGASWAGGRSQPRELSSGGERVAVKIKYGWR